MIFYRILLTLSFSALSAMALETPSLGAGGTGRASSDARNLRNFTIVGPNISLTHLQSREFHSNRPSLTTATNIGLARVSGHVQPPQLGGSPQAVAMRAQAAAREGVSRRTEGSSISVDTTRLLGSEGANRGPVLITATHPTELELASPQVG